VWTIHPTAAIASGFGLNEEASRRPRYA